MSTATPTTTTTSTVVLPSPGTWRIDPSHSSVAYSVRHLGLARSRGRFARFEGVVHISAEPASSRVDVTIDAASIESGDATRDAHLRSDDFLAVADHPHLTFRSSGVAATDDPVRWTLEGDLTIRDVTRPVRLDVSYEGAGVDPWGGQRVAFTAGTEIDREDFELTWNQVLETGGVLVGRKVRIDLEVELVREEAVQ